MCHLSMLYIVFLSTHASMPSREGELLYHMLGDGHLLKNRRGISHICCIQEFHFHVSPSMPVHLFVFSLQWLLF